MKKIQSIPMARVIGEGGIIVVSILLAFWIDAWWDGRQDRGQERQLLAQIQAESVSNRELFAQYRQHHSEIIEAAGRLLDRTGPGATVVEHEIAEIKRDLEIVSDFWTVEPSVGVISSALQSGQLQLIRSQELRVEVANWSAFLDDLRSEEASQQRFGSEVFLEYWYANAPLRNLWPVEELGQSKFPVDYEAILQDRRFENLLHAKVLGERAVLDDYQDIELSTANLIRMTTELLD